MQGTSSARSHPQTTSSNTELDNCQKLQQDLQEVAGQVKERRQIHDLPELCLVVEEHQNCGPFPTRVQAPAQYGPRLQALAVYLSHFQLLPMERVCEAMNDLCQCQLSEGTLFNWIAQAAKVLESTTAQIKEWMVDAPLQHADETGRRVKGILHWVHVNATSFLTLYSWHRKRGQEALEAIGIFPKYHGRAMHDRWSPYDHYLCAHSLCGAHLLRDCLFVAEQEKRPWGQKMFDLLLLMVQTTEQWRARGARALPQGLRDPLIAQYFA